MDDASYEHLIVKRDGDITTVTLDRPEKRNALAVDVMEELTATLEAIGRTDARGVVLAANGPVFSAGHNFGDMAGATFDEARHVFDVCTRMMGAVQSIPQPVCARVHALATAAGCQLVATCDLAVAAESAGFAIPGGKGGLFCHTPLVAVARNVGRKRALEMAFTGDAIDAATAADWGLINRAVPDDELDDAVDELMQPGDPRLGRVQGPRQAHVLRPGRPRPGQGLRARRPGHGRRRHHGRRPRGHRRLPREAQTGLLARSERRSFLGGDRLGFRDGSRPDTDPAQMVGSQIRRRGRCGAGGRWPGRGGCGWCARVTARSAATVPGEPARARSRTRSRSWLGTPAARASPSSRASSSHGLRTVVNGVSSSVRGSTDTSLADSRRPGAMNAR